MKNVKDFMSAKQTLPFVRAISKEVRERLRTVMVLEAQRRRAQRKADGHEVDLSSFDSRLAQHKRELRYAEKELARIGWRIDNGHPLRLAFDTGEGGAELTWRPEETGFYRFAAEYSR